MNSIRINRADIWELIAVCIHIILCEICVAVKGFPVKTEPQPSNTSSQRSGRKTTEEEKKKKMPKEHNMTE